MDKQQDIVEVMVTAARAAVSGYPHTQTITFQMRAALTALEQAGYAVVPVEPTEEMIRSAVASFETGMVWEPWRIYAAMLSARPSPLKIE